MTGRQAKLLTKKQLARLLRHVNTHSDPLRSRVVILLSVKAGLRAAEIAKLEWPMVLGPTGVIGHALEIDDSIAKKNAGRRVPIHPDLRRELRLLHRRDGGHDGPIIRSARGGALKPNSVVNWFIALFKEMGFAGCSSHSGRRTFITAAARMLPKTGGSLRDVQLLAGHSSIETTQQYIEGYTRAQQKLVSLL